jgi:hypothetical protein
MDKKIVNKILLAFFLSIFISNSSSGLDAVSSSQQELKACASGINDYNKTWLLNHNKRLNLEITELQTSLEHLKDWRLTQAKIILDMKKDALAKVNAAIAQIKNSPQQYRIFHSTNDLESFLSTGVIPGVNQKVGFIGKRLNGNITGSYELQIKKTQDEILRDLIKHNFLYVSQFPDCVFSLDKAEIPQKTLQSLGGKNIKLILAAVNKLIPKIQNESILMDLRNLSEVEQCHKFYRPSMDNFGKSQLMSFDVLNLDPVNFFDNQVSPEMSAFLEKLEIKKVQGPILDKEKNLENDFQQVRSQIVQNSSSIEGTDPYEIKTKACTGFAIVSDMEFTGNTPLLSAGLAYGMTKASQQKDSDKPSSLPDNIRSIFSDTMMIRDDNSFNYVKRLNEEIDTGADLLVALSTLKRNGVSSEKDFPFLNEQGQVQFLPNKLSDIQGKKYKIGEYAYVENKDKNINLGLVKLLINSNKPPIALLLTDARIEEENWAHPVANGNFQHVVNVIGYGEAIDPSDFKLKPVVILRDSLSKKGINITMSAESFLSNLSALIKVTKVDEEN